MVDVDCPSCLSHSFRTVLQEVGALRWCYSDKNSFEMPPLLHRRHSRADPAVRPDGVFAGAFFCCKGDRNAVASRLLVAELLPPRS